jgi:hypothetical protein
MARVSFGIAHFFLPTLVHNEFDKFLGIWRTTVPPIALMLCEYACSAEKVRPTSEFATAFKTYEGRLHAGCDYYILEFPPASLPAQIPHDRLIELMTKSPRQTVLAPYFAAIIDDHSSGRGAYYILGQRPGGGTTLRSVTADGVNANLGPGPQPTVASFLRCLTKRHVS